jgi:hypothetical protein
MLWKERDMRVFYGKQLQPVLSRDLVLEEARAFSDFVSLGVEVANLGIM